MYQITIAVYAVASILAVVGLMIRSPKWRTLARVALLVAAGAHLIAIGQSCLRGLHPLLDTAGALNLSAWLLVVGYMLGRLRWPLDSATAIIAPLAFGLTLAAEVTPRAMPSYASAAIGQRLGELHLAFAALGTAVFTLAAGVAGVFLIKTAALRRQRSSLFRSGPSLTQLETMGRVLTALGFVTLTLAAATGGLWLYKRPEPVVLRIEYLLTGGIWTMLAAMIIARCTVGIGARKAAGMLVVGFLGVAVILMIYAARRI